MSAMIVDSVTSFNSVWHHMDLPALPQTRIWAAPIGSFSTSRISAGKFAKQHWKQASSMVGWHHHDCKSAVSDESISMCVKASCCPAQISRFVLNDGPYSRP